MVTIRKRPKAIQNNPALGLVDLGAVIYNRVLGKTMAQIQLNLNFLMRIWACPVPENLNTFSCFGVKIF